MIVDTHCHLDFEEFNPDREIVIRRAREKGVGFFLNVGSSLQGSRKSIELSLKYEYIFASVGIHPHHADEVNKEVFAEIEKLAKHKNVVAIGEVGLDYCKSPSSLESQKKVFIEFIGLSKKLKLPLILHSRDSHDDMIALLREHGGGLVSGVMHCFSGGERLLHEALEMGLFISFTCNLSFKNAGRLREIAKRVPLERLLLETDAPFLAPQAFRGMRNEPSYITELRDTLSELLNMPKEKIENITTENAKRLFGIC